MDCADALRNLEAGVKMPDNRYIAFSQQAFGAQHPWCGHPGQYVAQPGSYAQGNYGVHGVPQGIPYPIQPPLGQPIHFQVPPAQGARMQMGYPYPVNPAMNMPMMRRSHQNGANKVSAASIVFAVLGFGLCVASIVGYLFSRANIAPFVFCSSGALAGMISLLFSFRKRRR